MRRLSSQHFIKIAFIAGLFLCPLFFWPWAKISFELPKVWLVLRWIEILSVITLLLFRYEEYREKIDLKLILLVVILLILVFISSLHGVNFYKSFWGNYYRADGLYTFIHLVLFFLFTSLVVRKKWVDTIIKTVSLSAVTLSVVFIINAVLFYFFDTNLPYLPDWYGVPGNPFGNPNFLAGFLTITLPFTSYQINNSYGKALIIFQIIAILLTQAWAGIFGILVFILGNSAIGGKKTLIIISIFSIVLLAFLYFYKNGSFIPSRANAESRQRIFTKGILSFTKKPVLGWGWANFDYAFDNAVWPIKMQNDVYVDKAHSIFLEILVTSGVLGFIAYIAVVVRTIHNLFVLKTSASKYLFLAFILFIIHSQTNVISISEELIFWLLTGISAKSG